MLVSPRTTNVLLVVMIAIGIAIVAMLANGAFAGPLDPPAAPGPTDGVRETGTPISSLPFTITQPGRYYLTRDLTGAASTTAVTIQTSDVTLDLNSFTLHGSPGSVDGVFVSGARSNVVIQNGTLRGWFNGIDAATATYSRVSMVTILGSSTSLGDGGYALLVGPSSVVEDCNVRNNKNHGIFAGEYSVIRNCMIAQTPGNGVRVQDSALVEGNFFFANGSAIGYAGLAIDGALVTVRGNTFDQQRDIILTPIPSVFGALIIDNVLTNCTSIANSGGAVAPRDGVEHSNVVVADGGGPYC